MDTSRGLGYPTYYVDNTDSLTRTKLVSKAAIEARENLPAEPIDFGEDGDNFDDLMTGD